MENALLPIIYDGVQACLNPKQTQMELCWPTNAPNFYIQASTNLTNPGWVFLTNMPRLSNGYHTVILPATNRELFYRLSTLPQHSSMAVAPMYMNPWMAHGPYWDDQWYTNQVDIVRTNGWTALGYKFIGIDDGWQAPVRDANGNLMPDPQKIRNITNLIQHIHNAGMMVEIYTEPSPLTCCRLPGSPPNFLAQDLTNFLAWGVDVVRIDFCYGNWTYKDRIALLRYARTMLNAIANRPVLLKSSAGITPGGLNQPAPDYNIPELLQVVNILQIVNDGNGQNPMEQWTNFLARFGESKNWRTWSGPGHWLKNDYTPLSWSTAGLGSLTCRSMIAMDGMINCMVEIPEFPVPWDPTAISLTNTDIISIVQDPLAIPGNPVITTNNTNSAQMEIWFKPLADEKYALAFMNRSTNQTFQAYATWADVGLPPGATYRVRDAINMAWLANQNNAITCNVPPIAASVFILSLP